MLNKETNWLVVADGGQARIFTYVGRYKQLQQLIHLSHPHPLTHEHGPDRPGRTFESATIHKHSYEPKTDWHEHEKLNFLEVIVQIIVKSHQKQEFKKITLVCPPHLIGGLRDKVCKYLKEEEINLVNKDFTHLNKEEIYKKLLKTET